MLVFYPHSIALALSIVPMAIGNVLLSFFCHPSPLPMFKVHIKRTAPWDTFPAIHSPLLTSGAPQFNDLFRRGGGVNSFTWTMRSFSPFTNRKVPLTKGKRMRSHMSMTSVKRRIFASTTVV